MAEELWVDNGDVRLHVEVSGEGPTILCVHGWPELAPSWHHQVAHFTERGYRVAALDVRGSGASSIPPEPARYTLDELAGDVAAVATALDDGPIVLFGHDWGAPIVWRAAIRHPERVRAVAGLSVPATPPSATPLLAVLDHLYPERFFYMLHFQEPGRMEAEFEADVRAALKRIYFSLSGDAPAGSWLPEVGRGVAFLPLLPEPPAGPLSFVTDDELDAYAATFARTGTTGSLNRYRALDADTQTVADIAGALVEQPSCFVGGALDPVRFMIPGADLYVDPGAACADFRGATIIDGAGHWVHQEAPGEVNAALEGFLAQLP